MQVKFVLQTWDRSTKPCNHTIISQHDSAPPSVRGFEHTTVFSNRKTRLKREDSKTKPFFLPYTIVIWWPKLCRSDSTASRVWFRINVSLMTQQIESHELHPSQVLSDPDADFLWMQVKSSSPTRTIHHDIVGWADACLPALLKDLGHKSVCQSPKYFLPAIHQSRMQWWAICFEN